MNASHDSITDVKKAGAVLLSAFEYAHNSIMEGKLAFWDAGTTTLLGGVLLEINKTAHPDVSSRNKRGRGRESSGVDFGYLFCSCKMGYWLRFELHFKMDVHSL